ncbi:MAG TPA: methyltransferase [Thermoanaerobaculia bacterium]
MATDPKSAPLPPPHVQVIQMGMGYWVSRALYAAAKLNLADKLAAGPRSAAELAKETKTLASALHRLMRLLAGLGILKTQSDGQRFSLTPLGEALKSDAPGAARATLLSLAGPLFWNAFGEYMYSLETGKTAFEKVYGMPAFDYLAKHPEDAANFTQAMVGVHGEEPRAVVAAYDFSGFGTVVDVGGASGNMVVEILNRYPKMRGVLFDLPHVVADAQRSFQARGLVDRTRVEGGSFFDRVPEGCDAYVLSHVIHDWSEEQCLTILGNCRKAMKPDAKVLIVEMVLPGGDEMHPGKLLDLTMLTMPGGQERTESEYAALLEKAGFRLTRVVPTQSAVSVVEAVKK